MKLKNEELSKLQEKVGEEEATVEAEVKVIHKDVLLG